jgi:hypothetical protein
MHDLRRVSRPLLLRRSAASRENLSSWLSFSGGCTDPSIPTTATSVPKLLRELGYVEGRNLQVERRFAAGKLRPSSATSQGVGRFANGCGVAVSPTAIKPAMDATKTIPIVMGFGKDRSEMDSSTALPSPAAMSPAWSWRPRTYSPEKDWS